MTLEENYPNTPQRVDTPLGIARVAEVIGEEILQILRECTLNDGLPCASHNSSLKDEVVLCDS